MLQLLIVADDFTGGLDTGIQFGKRGIRTALVQYEELSPEFLSDCACEVVVVDTHSRHVPPAEAYRRVTNATRMAKTKGCLYFYKKTDSTLRGNIGSELQAMLEGCKAERMVFAPAHPALGRTTWEGIQYVKGVPLAQTEFATDPFNPVTSSDLRSILAQQSSLPVRVIPQNATDKTLRISERGIYVADGREEADYESLAFRLCRDGSEFCFAGCGGFAGALAEALPLTRCESRFTGGRGGMLLACGSLHPMSVKQCHWAEASGGYQALRLTAEELLTGEISSDTINEMNRIMKQNGKLLLQGPGGRESLPETYGIAQRLGIDAPAQAIAAGFGKIVRETAASVGTLIVFGGDTLLGIASALGCRVVHPIAELLPGVVLSQLQTAVRSYYLVTKAGGFGSERLVGEISAALRWIQRED